MARYNHNESVERSSTPSPAFTVRIHLVRHGETEANAAGIVLGQIDSPLTNLGMQQSESAYETFGKDHDQFWKIVSSDLGRCVKTTRLVLGLEHSCMHNGSGSGSGSDSAGTGTKRTGASHRDESKTPSPHVILDRRLRERAKGVREGRSKLLSYDEAMACYIKECNRNCNSNSNRDPMNNTNAPLLENEVQVLDRMNDWLDQIILELCAHREINKGWASTRTSTSTGAGTGTGTRTCSRTDHSSNHDVYDILAISHSGTLRIFIENTVGDQLPSDVKREFVTDASRGKGRLVIPNTSKTVIEFAIHDRRHEEEIMTGDVKKDRSTFANSNAPTIENDSTCNGTRVDDHRTILRSAKLIDYTNVSHFGLIH